MTYNDMLTVTGFYSEDYVRSHQNSLGMHDILFTAFALMKKAVCMKTV